MHSHLPFSSTRTAIENKVCSKIFFPNLSQLMFFSSPRNTNCLLPAKFVVYSYYKNKVIFIGICCISGGHKAFYGALSHFLLTSGNFSFQNALALRLFLWKTEPKISCYTSSLETLFSGRPAHWTV